jgi:hypothetical protein
MLRRLLYEREGGGQHYRNSEKGAEVLNDEGSSKKIEFVKAIFINVENYNIYKHCGSTSVADEPL